MTTPIVADVLLIDFGRYTTASTRTDSAAAWLRNRVPHLEDRECGADGFFTLPSSTATDNLLDDMADAGFTLDEAWSG